MRERKRVALEFPKDREQSRSRCLKQFAKEADVNNVMKRFEQTGFLTDPLAVSERKPLFGDFSNIDFMSIRSTVADANLRFSYLKADVRAKFHNDVAELVKFISDPANADEARTLGLLPPLTKEQRAVIEAEAAKAKAVTKDAPPVAA